MVLGKLSANMPSRKRILEKQDQKGANLASLKCGPNLLFILSKIVVCSGYQRQMTFTCVFPAGGGGGRRGSRTAEYGWDIWVIIKMAGSWPSSLFYRVYGGRYLFMGYEDFMISPYALFMITVC